MMMTTTWALIADSNQATIFETKGRRKELEIVEWITRAEPPPAGPHENNPRETIAAADVQQFAHEIAAKLRHGREQHAFEQLVIAAPPPFLGVLRKVIDPVTARTIVGEVGKHLGGRGDGDLRAHIAPQIPL
jgi:protein required for attachment to host cells